MSLPDKPSDYALRYLPMALVSSFWSVHVVEAQQAQLRALASAAAGAWQTPRIRGVADRALGARRLLLEDVTFPFTDGNFAHVGDDLRSALREVDDRMTVVKRRRDYYPDSTAQRGSVNILFRRLPALEHDFDIIAGGHMEIPTTDAYLIPIPDTLTPVIINSKIPDVYFVQGIDFEVYKGFLMFRENPAEVLPLGDVTCALAYEDTDSPNKFFWGLPRAARNEAHMAKFKKQAGSTQWLRAALAEYMGMWVAVEDDMVLEVRPLAQEVLYVMRRAGVVTIDYPHWLLSVGQSIYAGQPIAGHLGIRTASSAPWRAWGPSTPHISLDRLLPVAGLALPASGMIEADKLPGVGGFDKVRYHYIEQTPGSLEKLWNLQDTADAILGSPPEPVTLFGDGETTVEVNMWDILAAHYGDTLLFVEIGACTPVMRERALAFIREHCPVGVVLIPCDIPETLVN